MLEYKIIYILLITLSSLLLCPAGGTISNKEQPLVKYYRFLWKHIQFTVSYHSYIKIFVRYPGHISGLSNVLNDIRCPCYHYLQVSVLPDSCLGSNRPSSVQNQKYYGYTAVSIIRDLTKSRFQLLTMIGLWSTLFHLLFLRLS